MKPVLVTGASGFIGWHVARLLIEQGRRVRALLRPTSRLRGLEAETIIGDLRDRDSLDRAVAGCDTVYHVAADYWLWAKDPSELYRSNVDGTRNLLEASLRAAVDRVVYTSTVGCIGIPEDGPGDEDSPVAYQDMVGDYKRSKFQAERTALEYAAAGVPVVIVNPTAPIGDHDFKPTPTGKIILDLLKGDMPAYIDTGLNLVDVEDTAKGHILACERGRPGERYILGCENLVLAEILRRVAAAAGLKAPALRIPYRLAYAAGVVTTAWADWTGNEPRAPLDAVRMARKKMFVSHQKAVRELGYDPKPVDGAIRRAVDWFRGNGYC